MRRTLTIMALIALSALPASAAISGADYSWADEAELGQLELPPETVVRPETVAVVTALDGDAVWSGSDTAELQALALGSIIPNGARIELAETATMTVAFNDAGSVDCKAGGKVALENDGAGTCRILLTEGQIRMLGELRGPVRSVEVVTVAATIGIRGTEFEVAAAEDGTTELYVDEGTVAFSDQLSGEETAVTAGEAAAASTEAPLARREFISREQRQQHMRQMRQQRREQLREHFGEIIERLEPRFQELKEKHRRLMDKLHAVRAQRQELENQRDNRRLSREEMQQRTKQWLQAGKQELLIYQALEQQNQRLAQFKRWVEGLQLPPDLPDAAREKMRDLGESLRRIFAENREALRSKPELVNRLRQAQQRIRQYRQAQPDNQGNPARPARPRRPR